MIEYQLPTEKKNEEHMIQRREREFTVDFHTFVEAFVMQIANKNIEDSFSMTNREKSVLNCHSFALQTFI